MMNVGAVETLATGRVKRIALGQEMLERSGPGVKRRRNWPVRRAQFRRLRAVSALGAVVDPGTTAAFQLHGRVPIRQAIENARSPHRGEMAGVEAEEKDTPLGAEG